METPDRIALSVFVCFLFSFVCFFTFLPLQVTQPNITMALIYPAFASQSHFLQLTIGSRLLRFLESVLHRICAPIFLPKELNGIYSQMTNGIADRQANWQMNQLGEAGD